MIIRTLDLVQTKSPLDRFWRDRSYCRGLAICVSTCRDFAAVHAVCPLWRCSRLHRRDCVSQTVFVPRARDCDGGGRASTIHSDDRDLEKANDVDDPAIRNVPCPRRNDAIRYDASGSVFDRHRALQMFDFETFEDYLEI